MSRTTKKRVLNKISRAVRRFTQRNLRRIGFARRRAALSAAPTAAPQLLFARKALASSVWAVAGVATVSALSFAPTASALSDCDASVNTVNPGDPYSTSGSVGSLAFDVCDIVDDLTIAVNDTHVVSANGDTGSDFAAIEVVAWNDRDADHDDASNGYADGLGEDGSFTGVDFGEANGNVAIQLNAGGVIDAYEAFGIHVLAEGDAAEAATNDQVVVNHTHGGLSVDHTLAPNQAATDGDITISLDGLVTVDAAGDVNADDFLAGVYADARLDIVDAQDKNGDNDDDDDSNTGEVIVRGSGSVEVSWESLGGEDDVKALGIGAFGDESVNVGGVEGDSTLTVEVDVYGAVVDVYADGVRAESQYGDVYVDNIRVVADATADESGAVEAIGVVAHADYNSRHAELKDATVTAIARGDQVSYIGAGAADLSGDYVTVADSALAASARLVADAGIYNIAVYGLAVDDAAQSVESLTVSGMAYAYTEISAAVGLSVGNAINSLAGEVNVSATGVYAEVDDAITMRYTDVSVAVGQVDEASGAPLYDDEGNLLAATVTVSEGETPSRSAVIDVVAMGLDFNLEDDGAYVNLDYVNVDVDIAAEATGGSPGELSDVDVDAYGLYVEMQDDSRLTIDDSDIAVNVVVASDDTAFVNAIGLYVEHGGSGIELLLEDTDIAVTASMSLLADGDSEGLASTSDYLDANVIGFEAQDSDWSDLVHLDGVEISATLTQIFDSALAGEADADVTGIYAETDRIVMRDTAVTARHTVEGGTVAEDVAAGDDIRSDAYIYAVELEATDVDLEGVQARAEGVVDLGGSNVSADIYAETHATGIDLVSWGGEDVVSLADVQGYADIDAQATSVTAAGAGGTVRLDLIADGIDITDDGDADSFLIDEGSVGAASIRAVAVADDSVDIFAISTGLQIGSAGPTVASIDMTDVTGTASLYIESDSAEWNSVVAEAVGIYVEARTIEFDGVDAAAYARVAVDGESAGEDAFARVNLDVVGLYAEVYGDMTIEQSQFAAEAVVSVDNVGIYDEKYGPVNVGVNVGVTALELELYAVDADASLTSIDVAVNAALSVENFTLDSFDADLKYSGDSGASGVDADIVGIDFSADFGGDNVLEAAGRVDFTDLAVSSESITVEALGELGGGWFGNGEDFVGIEVNQFASIDDVGLLDLEVAGIEVRGDVVTDSSGLSPEYDALDVGMADVVVDFAQISATAHGSSLGYFTSGEDIVGNGLVSADVVGINIGADAAAGERYNGFYAEIGDVALDNVRVYLDDVTVGVSGSQLLVLEGEDNFGVKYIGQNHMVSGDVWGIAIDSNFGDVNLDDVTVATEVTGYAAGISLLQVVANNAGIYSDGNDIVSIDSIGINLVGDQEITLSNADVTVAGNAQMSGFATSGVSDYDGYIERHFDNDGIDMDLTGVVIDGDNDASLGVIEQSSVAVTAHAQASGYVTIGIGEDGLMPFSGSDVVDYDGEVIELGLDGVKLFDVDEAQVTGIEIAVVADASVQPKYQGDTIDELFGYVEDSPLVALAGDDVLELEAEGLYVEADVIDIQGVSVDITVTNFIGSEDSELAAFVAAASGDDLFDVNIDGIDLESYSEGSVGLVDFDIAISESNTFNGALVAAGGSLSASTVTGLEINHYDEGSITLVKDIAADGLARADAEWSVDVLSQHSLSQVAAGEEFGFMGLFGLGVQSDGVYVQSNLVDVQAEGIDAYADAHFSLGGAELGEFVAVRTVIDVDASGEMASNRDNFELSAYAVDIDADDVTVNQLIVDSMIDVNVNGSFNAGDDLVYVESRALDIDGDVVTLSDVTLHNQLRVNIEGYAEAGAYIVHADLFESTVDGDESLTLARVDSRVVIDIDIDATDLGEDGVAVSSSEDLIELHNVAALDAGTNGEDLVANQLYVGIDWDVDVTGSVYSDDKAVYVEDGQMLAAYFDSNGRVDLDDVTVNVDVDINLGAYVEAHDEEVYIESLRGMDFNADELELETFDVDMSIAARAENAYAEVDITAVGIGADDVSDSLIISAGTVDISLTGYANAYGAGEGDNAVYLEATAVWSSASYTSMHDVDIDVELHASANNSIGYVETEAYGAWISNAEQVSVSVGADNAITVKATSSGGNNEARAEALTITADHLLNNVDDASLLIAGTVSASAYAEGGSAYASALSLTTYGGGNLSEDGLDATALTIVNSGAITAYAEGSSAYARALYVDSMQGEDASQEVIIDNLEGGVISATVGAADGYGTAIAVYSEQNVTITNDGSITGRIITGAGDDLLTNNSANTWHAFGTSSFGYGDDTIDNAATGRIVMTDATIDLGSLGAVGVYVVGNAFSNSGVIEVIGDNVIDMGMGYGEYDVSNPNAMVNSGHIDFTDSDDSTDDSLMVYGDFYSDGGELTVDIDGGEELSDMLSISGDLTGTTVVNAILHSVPHGQSEFAVQVINVEGDQVGDITLGDVTIADDHLFDWDITRSWNLDSGDDNDGWLSLSVESLSDAGVAMTSIAPALQSLWHQSVGTLAQREGLLRSNGDGSLSLWVRGFSQSGDVEVSNSWEADSSFGLDVDGWETGVQVALTDALSIGLIAGESNADFDISHGAGDGSFDGDSLGGFIQYRTDKLVAEFSYREMDFDGRVVSGAVSEQLKGSIDGYNVELGYTFELESGLKIQPQIQVTEANLDFDNLANVATTYGYFTQHEGDSARSRFGVMISRDYVSGDDRWTPHVTLSSVYEGDAANDYEINGLQGTADASGTSMALEVGISGTVGQAVFFGGLNYLDGGVNDAITGVQAGFKFRF